MKSSFTFLSSGNASVDTDFLLTMFQIMGLTVMTLEPDLAILALLWMMLVCQTSMPILLPSFINISPLSNCVLYC